MRGAPAWAGPKLLAGMRGGGGGHASGRWYLEVGVANRQGSTPQGPLGAETRKEEEGCHIFVAFFLSNTGYLGAGLAAGSTPPLLISGQASSQTSVSWVPGGGTCREAGEFFLGAASAECRAGPLIGLCPPPSPPPGSGGWALGTRALHRCSTGHTGRAGSPAAQGLQKVRLGKAVASSLSPQEPPIRFLNFRVSVHFTALLAKLICLQVTVRGGPTGRVPHTVELRGFLPR